MATHSNGISALQLQKQLGIGSYRSAWLLAHKLRASMVDPERNPLSGLVEIDEASLPFRTKDDPPTGGQGLQPRPARCSSSAPSNSGTETSQAACGWPKSPPTAPPTSDTSSKPPPIRRHRENRRLVTATLRSPPIATMIHVVGKTAAHLVLPWIHQIFSNLKGWARGVYHGLRRKHLQAYLDEFVFRFNRRKTRHAAFRSLFRLATNAEPLTYRHVDRTGAMCISGSLDCRQAVECHLAPRPVKKYRVPLPIQREFQLVPPLPFQAVARNRRRSRPTSTVLRSHATGERWLAV